MKDSIFAPVLDISDGTLTSNQVQGVLGLFVPVLDDSQGAPVESPATAKPAILSTNAFYMGL